MSGFKRLVLDKLLYPEILPHLDKYKADMILSLVVKICEDAELDRLTIRTAFLNLRKVASDGTEHETLRLLCEYNPKTPSEDREESFLREMRDVMRRYGVTIEDHGTEDAVLGTYCPYDCFVGNGIYVGITAIDDDEEEWR